MLWGGVLIALFVLYHLADLTIGAQTRTTSPVMSTTTWSTASNAGRSPCSTSSPCVFLALHIYHGAWSLFQSLGMANPRYDVWRRWLAVALALAILIGNSSIPIAVQLGILTVSG